MWYFVNDDFSMAAGTIDEESLPKGTLSMLGRPRIFLEDKAGWYDIPDDGAPGYERFGGDFEKKLGEWRMTGAGFVEKHGEGK